MCSNLNEIVYLEFAIMLTRYRLKLANLKYKFLIGELRVCTYCCKVVLTYLQSNNIEEDVLADLKALQEELLPPKPSIKSLDAESGIRGNVADLERQPSTHIRRKTVYGFMEENYTIKSRQGPFYYFIKKNVCFDKRSLSKMRETEKEKQFENQGTF